MKGILKKTQSGWIVNYDYTVNKNDWCTLPLHPADVEQINKDSQVFDNIEARIAAYSEVEFEVVYVSRLSQTYAKLIHHSVESNEMVEDDGLTDDEWLIKQKHLEIEATAIDFAEWISKNDWMSMWVEDKWMWEYQSSQYGEELPSTHKWFGYKTNEQLFELYKASKQ